MCRCVSSRGTLALLPPPAREALLSAAWSGPAHGSEARAQSPRAASSQLIPLATSYRARAERTARVCSGVGWAARPRRVVLHRRPGRKRPLPCPPPGTLRSLRAGPPTPSDASTRRVRAGGGAARQSRLSAQRSSVQPTRRSSASAQPRARSGTGRPRAAAGAPGHPRRRATRRGLPLVGRRRGRRTVRGESHPGNQDAVQRLRRRYLQQSSTSHRAWHRSQRIVAQLRHVLAPAQMSFRKVRGRQHPPFKERAVRVDGHHVLSSRGSEVKT